MTRPLSVPEACLALTALLVAGCASPPPDQPLSLRAYAVGNRFDGLYAIPDTNGVTCYLRVSRATYAAQGALSCVLVPSPPAPQER